LNFAPVVMPPVPGKDQIHRTYGDGGHYGVNSVDSTPHMHLVHTSPSRVRARPYVRANHTHRQTPRVRPASAVSSSLSQPISLTRAESQGRLGSPSYLRTARSHLPFGASFLADRCCSQSIMQFVASCARASDRSREPARVLRNLQTSTSTAARGRAALAPVACY
jgi:hypothetical protein